MPASIHARGRAGWPEGRMSARHWRELAWYAARGEPGRLAIVGGIEAVRVGDLLRIGPAGMVSIPERRDPVALVPDYNAIVEVLPA